MNKTNERLAQARRSEVRRQRFAAGLRDMTTYHRTKALIPLAYLLILALLWANRSRALVPLLGCGML